MSTQNKSKSVTTRSNSLKGLIVLAKIGRVLSIIAFALGVIIAAGSIVLLIYSYLGKDIKLAFLGNQTLATFFANLPIVKQYNFAYQSIGMISLFVFFGALAESIIATRAMSYFKHVIYADTPFTLRGSRELLKLGIAELVALALVALACGITYFVYIKLHNNMMPFMISYVGIPFGITFIIVSVLTRHGAEINRKLNQLE